MPCQMSHASIPEDQLKLPRDLIRLCIGIEHVNDLLDDLKNALKKAGYDINLYNRQALVPFQSTDSLIDQ